MHKDLYNNCKTVLSLATVALASDADTNGIIIDTDNFESGKVSLITGAYTAGNIVISAINESDDSGMAGATAIPAERLIGTATAVSVTNTVDELGFVSTKRYVQVVYTTADTADLTATSTVELGDPSSADIRS